MQDTAAVKDKIFEQVPFYETRLMRNYEADYDERERVRNPDEVVELLGEFFKDKTREHVVVLMLDNSNAVIGMTIPHVGALDQSVMEPRAIFQPAILANAAGIILVHNHPSGNPTPSPGDVATTSKFKEAGDLLTIPLYDHIVIGDGDHESMAEKGII